MPPPAVELSPTEVNWVRPSSDEAGVFGLDKGSAASVTSRARFVKVKRQFKSRTVSKDQLSSATDSFGSAPSGCDQVTIDSSNACRGGIESLGIRSSCEPGGFVFIGAERTADLKLSSSTVDSGHGNNVGSDFVFGSSQCQLKSTSETVSKNILEHLGKLNLGDNQKMKAADEAVSHEVKTEDVKSGFQSEGNLNTDYGLPTGVFVFKGKPQISFSRGRKSSDDNGSAHLENQNDDFHTIGADKTSNVNSQVTFDAALNLKNGSEGSQMRHMQSPSVDRIEIPHIEVRAAVGSDRKSKTFVEMISVHGSNGNLSRQSTENCGSEPPVFMSKPGPSYVTTNLFSKTMEAVPCQESSRAGSKAFEKGMPMEGSTIDSFAGNHYIAEERNTGESSSTSNCYSPMDFSPYQERMADDHQSSLGRQTNRADVSGSSGDISGLEKAEQGSFAFCASPSLKNSSLRDQLKTSPVECNSAFPCTSQASIVGDALPLLRRHNGCSSDKEGSLNEASRGEFVKSRKLRSRLVKLRKQSHGRSETAQIHQKNFIPSPISAVPDGPFQVNADSSTAVNSGAPQDNCSFLNGSFVFCGSCRASVSKPNETEEECSSSKSWKHEKKTPFSFAYCAGSKSTSLFYSSEFAAGVNKSFSDVKTAYGYPSGVSSFYESGPVSKGGAVDGQEMGNLSSRDSENGRTSSESGFVFGLSQLSVDQGPDNGNRSNILSSGKHGSDASGKDESGVSSRYSDGMHKLNDEVENFDGDHGSKAQGHGENVFIFRSNAEASDTHADSFPSSSGNQIRYPSIGLCGGVETGTNIRRTGEDHVTFGHGVRVPGEFPATSYVKPFIFRTGSAENDDVTDGGHQEVSSDAPSTKDGVRDDLKSMSSNDGRGSSVNARLFPELNSEFKFREPAGSIREKKSGKRGKLRPCSRNKLNTGKQNVPGVDHVKEKQESPICFPAMGLSASNELGAANKFMVETSSGPADSNIDNRYMESHSKLDTENLCSSMGNATSTQDVNLSKAEESPREMQFSFVPGVLISKQGGFVFSASTSVGLGSPVKKRQHKKLNSAQRASVCSVFKPDSSSSYTLPSESTSAPQGDASCMHEDEDKPCLNGQGTRGQNEVSSSASIQEACEKWRFRGNQAYKNGHFSRAERFYTKGIELVPSHETSGCCLKPLLLCYSNRAATRMSVGRLREAIDDCSRAQVLDPNFLKVQIREANCHLVLGDIENAKNCFHKCLKSGTNICLDRRLIIEAADGLQRTQKVDVYIKILEDRSPDAESRTLELISEALSISKFSEKLLRMKAEALYTSRKYEEVIQLCKQSLIIAEQNLPTSAVPKTSEDVDDLEGEAKLSVRLWRFFLMAKSHFCLGRLEEALDLLQRVEQTGCVGDRSASEFMVSANSLSTTISKLLDYKRSGNEAFRSKKYAEAVEHYTTAISSCGESRPFAAICFCNRAAAHQALGQIADAIADCSLAIALDGNYAKAVSRRATLHELIRHYEQAANDDSRLIKILQSQPDQKSRTSGGTGDRANELKKAYKHKSSMDEQSKKEVPLDLYNILGVKKSDTAADIKKAYRKAALRHHPDKAAQFLRSDSGCEGLLWKEIAELIHEDADSLFKMIGEAYAILSDPSKRDQYDLEEEIRKSPKESSVYSSRYRNSPESYGFPSWRRSGRRYGEESWKTYGSSHSRW